VTEDSPTTPVSRTGRNGVVAQWIRTNRRAPGSPYEGFGQRFHPGPWHAIRGSADGSPIGGRFLSWCGKHPTAVTINVRHHSGATPPDLAEGERLCPTCVTAIKNDRPRPYRRR
jgi:hypothetical protein